MSLKVRKVDLCSYRRNMDEMNSFNNQDNTGEKSQYPNVKQKLVVIFVIVKSDTVVNPRKQKI